MIDVNPNHLETVKRILAAHVPECEVRAFGSRVNWTAKDYSDLDLVVVCDGALEPDVLRRLKDSFEESDLPFRVDVMDWHTLDTSFRKAIGRKCEVVHGSKKNGSGATDLWEFLTIGDLCDAGYIDLQTGPFGTQLHAHDYVREGVSVVPTEALHDRQIDHSVLPRISAAKAAQLERHRLKAGDILFARRGVQATGNIGYVRNAEEGFLCGTGAIRLRLISTDCVLTSDFLSHLLADPASVAWFKFHSIGATMPNLNEGIIRSFPLRIPPKAEQRAIARVLGTLDDKIELNRRMNETLEATARALFKSWFVDFDPVRAKIEGRDSGLSQPLAGLFPDSFEDSELGEVPKGWEIRGLDEIARFLNGLALQKYPPADGHWLPAIKIVQLRSGDTVGADAASADLDTDYIVEDGDVLFSWSGSLECVLWTGGRGALNQHLFKVTSTEFPKWFYYLWIHQHLVDFRHTAAGKATTMGHIQRHHLSDAKVVVPASDILEAAGETLSSVVQRVITTRMESRTLAALRDTLIPKLISGELRFKHANLYGESATK